MIVIDRFEGSRAVLEIDGERVEVPRTAIPVRAREGDALELLLADASGLLQAAEERLERLRARDSTADDIEL